MSSTILGCAFPYNLISNSIHKAQMIMYFKSATINFTILLLL